MKKRIGLVAALIGFMVMFYLSSPDYAHPQEGMSEFMQDVGVDDDKIVVPPPTQIRDYSPQPNRLMVVEYANERVFVYQIEKIIPRPECNQIKVDARDRIRVTTQSLEQAYEYILEPSPIMVSEWVQYDN